MVQMFRRQHPISSIAAVRLPPRNKNAKQKPAVGPWFGALTANSAHLQPGRSGSGSPHWFAGMLV